MCVLCVCIYLQYKCVYVSAISEWTLYLLASESQCILGPSVMMMMVSDDCLVECKIDDDSDEYDDREGEQITTPPPPPEFASKVQTPASKPPTPSTAPATPTPTHTPTSTRTPSPTLPVNRDPHGINQHLKVHSVILFCCYLLWCTPRFPFRSSFLWIICDDTGVSF